MGTAQLQSALPRLLPPSHDPFWQTPIRSVQARSAGFDYNIPQPSEMANASPQTPYARRTLQCTHGTMTRAHGYHDCQFCGKIPSHGYVYVCCQDEDQAERTIPAQHITLLSEHITTQSFEAKAYMAQALGMSTSIVEQIRKGFYNSDEVNKLFSQRRHVIDVLREVVQGESSDVGDFGRVQQQSSDNAGSGVLGGVVAGQKPITVKSPPCNLQVCHNCKPFLRDRIFAQPSSVLEKDSGYWTAQDLAWLPIHNASILGRLVLPGDDRPFRSEHGTTPVSISSSEYSDSSSDAYSFIFAGAGGRHNRAWDDHNIRDVTNMSSPLEGLIRDADQTTPFRSRPQEHFTPDLTESPLSDTTNSPTGPATTPLTPLRHDQEAFEASFEKKIGTFAKSASFCGPFRPRDSSKERTLSSTWSNGDCDNHDRIGGGIALTEESIETGVPDIVTA